MTTTTFTAILWVGSFAAGILGSLTGLGGGVVIVPFLTLGFGIDIRYAIGASLVSVIATSSGAAAAFVSEGFTNVRVAMFLEVATTLGALAGAALAAYLNGNVIAVTFGAVLIYSSWGAVQRHAPITADEKPDPLSRRLRLDGSFPEGESQRRYLVRNVPGGFALMGAAGVLSGLLGIGSGALKVLAMDRVMKIPYKVSSATSNFMIGVTAAASAGVYLKRGYLDPGLAMPVMLGVLAGALLGARILVKAPARVLRIVFALVVFALGIEMIRSGLSGHIQ